MNLIELKEKQARLQVKLATVTYPHFMPWDVFGECAWKRHCGAEWMDVETDYVNQWCDFLRDSTRDKRVLIQRALDKLGDLILIEEALQA